jgi:hypothetical protein
MNTKKKSSTHNNSTSSSITLNKRSNAMKATSIFRRGMSVLIALFLMVGFAISQNLVITSTTTVTNTGTIKVKGDITNSGVAGATSLGKVQLKANAAQAIGTATNGAINFSELSILATGGATKTFNVNSTVSTSIDIAASADASSQYDAGGKTLTISGTIANTGNATTPYVFSGSGSTVNYAGGGQTVFAPAAGLTYYNLTVSTAGGDKSLANNVTVSNALTVDNSGVLAINGKTLTVDGNTYDLLNSGTVKGGATSNLVLNGSGNLPSFAVTSGLNNLTLNRSGNTATLGADLSIEGAATLTAGTLAVSTHQLTLNGTGSVITGAGSLTSADAGTVNYAANAQNVFTANYGNLTFGSDAKTFPNATVGIAGTLTKGSASFTMGTGTVDFNGSGSQNIPLFSFYDLTTSNTGTKTATGNLTVTHNFDNGGGSNNATTLLMDTYTLGITGTKENTSGTIKFAGASNGLAFSTGIIEYNGDIAQAITAGTYNDLRFSTALLTNQNRTLTAITVNTASSLTVPQYISLRLDGTSALNLTGAAATLTVNGDLQNAGTIDIAD